MNNKSWINSSLFMHEDVFMRVIALCSASQTNALLSSWEEQRMTSGCSWSWACLGRRRFHIYSTEQRKRGVFSHRGWHAERDGKQALIISSHHWQFIPLCWGNHCCLWLSASHPCYYDGPEGNCVLAETTGQHTDFCSVSRAVLYETTHTEVRTQH